MPGWNLKAGKLNRDLVGEDEYWSLFNYVFSSACLKRNTYKFGLLKSIMDNLFNCIYDDSSRLYKLSYEDLFQKFTINYWNLVLKYNLRQMRPDGKSDISKIESILIGYADAHAIPDSLDFLSLNEADRKNIVQQVSLACRRNVIGALYTDMEGKLYEFDLYGDGISISEQGYNFILKYKFELEKLNYYAWAKFMEKINDDKVLIRLLDKLELSTPKRDDLSVYRELLFQEFEECNCFYCGRKLKLDGRGTHVDHFIPWSYIKDDKLWNFVLSCPNCNEKKNNKIPAEKYLEIMMKKNEHRRRNFNEVVQIDFESYNPEKFVRMWKYAQLSGMKQFVCL